MPDDGSDDGIEQLRQVEWTRVEDLGDLPPDLADLDDDDDCGGDYDLADDPNRDHDGPPEGEGGSFDTVKIPRSLRGRLHLPDDCPVVPLGAQDDTNYYLDVMGQLRAIKADKHGQNTIKHLFGSRQDYLFLKWPRLKEDPGGGWVATGWKPEEAGSALMDACARKGVWNPQEKVRGAGGWKGENGALVMHLGNTIGVWQPDGAAPEWYQPRLLDGFVYPTRPPLPHPDKQPEGRDGVGPQVLAMLRSWGWVRPDVDPYLALGWIIAAYMGGALKWRPLVWVVGDKGTGKSTLHALIKALLGNFLLSTADATAAGIYQTVGYDSRAVGIDEAEPDEESNRLKALLALARAAASGAPIHRGGKDHEAFTFTQKAPFLFSSINMPPLNGADRSRMAVLALNALPDVLPKGATAPPSDERELERMLVKMGRKLLRRIVDAWPRLHDVLVAYRRALKEAGHTDRGADVFGTLLACAHVALSDDVPTADNLAIWAKRLKASDLSELSSDLAANKACLLHLLTSALDVVKGGQRHTAGEWVDKLVAALDDPQPIDATIKDLRDIVRSYGLDVRAAPAGKGEAGLYLWVAYRHNRAGELFSGSAWASRSGSAGSWVEQLKTLPGAISNVSFFCGGPDKAVLVPVRLCSESPPEGGHDNLSAAGRSPSHDGGHAQAGGQASDRSAADAAQASVAPTHGSFDLFALDD